MRTPRLLLGTAAVAVLLAACGDSPVDDSAATTTVARTTAPTTAAAPTAAAGSTVPKVTVPKPSVAIPASPPTKLVVTDVKTGTGPKAAVGDTVVVNYVGVRSADGTEFDNSYDRGSTLPVTLGAGGVIPGWEQGLVGAQTGGRRQLDIPADLAYGNSPPQGQTVIKAGDALSFVIDVVAVVPKPDPSKAPAITIAGGPNVTAIVTKDLVVGTGADLVVGQTAASNIIAYRADTGAELANSWTDGRVQNIPFTADGSLPGIFTGMTGMKIGGRRQITIPYAQAFGDAGSTNLKLPAKTDLIVVIDVLAAY